MPSGMQFPKGLHHRRTVASIWAAWRGKSLVNAVEESKASNPSYGWCGESKRHVRPKAGCTGKRLLNEMQDRLIIAIKSRVGRNLYDHTSRIAVGWIVVKFQ